MAELSHTGQKDKLYVVRVGLHDSVEVMKHLPVYCFKISIFRRIYNRLVIFIHKNNNLLSRLLANVADQLAEASVGSVERI